MRKPFNGAHPQSQKFGNDLILKDNRGIEYHVYAQYGLKGHNGIDYSMPTGTEVVAPHAGYVKEAVFDNGYGNYVKIENEREGSVLAHLDTIAVRTGFQVNEGDVIGASNNTGNSTGPHLHWGYYKIPRDKNNGYNGYIDQQPFLNIISPSQPTPQVYSQDQYDTCMKDREMFWKERDTALKQVEETTKKYNEINTIYTAFTALGFLNVDEVIKVVKEKDDKILSQQIELKQVLDRNIKLLDSLKAKDMEDASAIELGIKAMKENGQLKSKIAELIRSVGGEGGHRFNDILNYIEYIKKIASVWKKEQADKQKEEDKVAHKLEEKYVKTESPITEFLKAIGFGVFFIVIFLIFKDHLYFYFQNLKI